jgi:O-antigen ligase/Flp pilus assembly protein TadD
LTKRDATPLSPHLSESDGSATACIGCEPEPAAHPPYHTVLQVAVLALLFLTPLIFPWRIQHDGALNYRFSSFMIPKEAFALTVIVFAACYWLIAMMRDGATRFRSHPILFPIAAFTALAGISVLYSPARYTSAVDFAKLCAVILFFLISLNAFLGMKETRTALYAIFLSGLVVATASLVQLFGIWCEGHPDVRFPMLIQPIVWLAKRVAHLFPLWPGNPQRMYSTFGNDSGVAGYLLPIVPIGIGLFLTNRSKGAKWICFLATGAIAYAVLACHTRGVWLGAFVALVFLLISMLARRELRAILRSHRPYLAVALVLAIVSLWIQLKVPGASTDEIDTMERITSTFQADQVGVNLRAVFWGAALRMAADRPLFGFGLGSYKYYSHLYQGKLMAAAGPASWLWPNELETVRAHNDYVQVASELGIVGIAVLVWGTLVFWKSARVRLRHAADGGSACLLLSCLSGLIGVAVFAATNFPFHLITHALVFMFLLAAVVAGDNAGRARFTHWRVPQVRSLRIGVSIFVAAFGILFLAFLLRPYAADYHVSSARLLGSAEHRSDAELAELHTAVRIEPRNGSIMALLGRAYLVRDMMDEAKRAFARALEEYDAAWVHIDYGAACEARGDLPEAVRHYADAVFRVPRYPVAHELLVRALMNAGRYEEARKRAKEALQWVGETPRLLNLLAAVSYRMGDREESRRSLERSLRVNPNQNEIRNLLKRADPDLQKTPS